MASFTSYVVVVLVVSHFLTVFVSFEINSNFKSLMLEQVHEELTSYASKFTLGRELLKNSKESFMTDVETTAKLLLSDVTNLVETSTESSMELQRLRAKMSQLQEQIDGVLVTMKEVWEKDLKEKAKKIEEAAGRGPTSNLALPPIDPTVTQTVRHAKETWLKEEKKGLCPEGQWQDGHWVSTEACSSVYKTSWTPEEIKECKEKLENHWIIISGDELSRQLFETLALKLDLWDGSNLATEQFSDRERYDGKMRLSLRFVPYMETGSESFRKAKNLVTQPSFAKLYKDGKWQMAYDLPFAKTYKRPDIVFMNTGIWELNNVKEADWDSYWELVFAQRFSDLLKLIKENRSFDRFVWMTIPELNWDSIDINKRPFYSPQRIKYLNVIERNLALLAGFEVLDLEALSSQPTGGGKQPQFFEAGLELKSNSPLLEAWALTVLSWTCSPRRPSVLPSSIPQPPPSPTSSTSSSSSSTSSTSFTSSSAISSTSPSSSEATTTSTAQVTNEIASQTTKLKE